MELALEADELAAMGPGQTVHDPFLMAAVQNRHSRPTPREKPVSPRAGTTVGAGRMHVGLTAIPSRMAILTRMQRAEAPPPSVGRDGGGPSASKGRDAWEGARGRNNAPRS